MFGMLATGIAASMIGQTVLGKTDYFFDFDESANETEPQFEGNIMKWGNMVFSK